MHRGRYAAPNGLGASLEPTVTEYPPPDPDGRPHIWAVFDFGDPSEIDLGRLSSSMGSIRKQQLELGEGLEVVMFDDDGDVWVLVEGIVDRFNPQRGSWIVRLDWSTHRSMAKPGAE
jgi:streptogramin lyase